jgi:hypothetical protein
VVNARQWEALRSVANFTGLYNNERFMAWLWDGNGVSGQICIKQDLEFLAFGTWNHLYGWKGMPRATSKAKVRKAAATVGSQSMRATIVKEMQRELRVEIQEIESELDTAKRSSLVQAKPDPEVIVMDTARKVVARHFNRVLDQLDEPSPTPLLS